MNRILNISLPSCLPPVSQYAPRHDSQEKIIRGGDKARSLVEQLLSPARRYDQIKEMQTSHLQVEYKDILDWFLRDAFTDRQLVNLKRAVLNMEGVEVIRFYLKLNKPLGDTNIFDQFVLPLADIYCHGLSSCLRSDPKKRLRVLPILKLKTIFNILAAIVVKDKIVVVSIGED